MAQTVKNLPAEQETWVQSLGWEDPLEKGMATHSSILAWKIPWAEEPGGLQSMGLQRAGPDGSDLAHIRKTKERERETMVGFSVERFENYSCPEKRRGSREDVVGEWAGEGV